MTDATHLSRFALERHVAGLLDTDATRAARAHLETCERCQSRARALDADQRAFLTRYPTPASFLPARPRRLRERPRVFWRDALAAACAAAALVMVAPRLLPQAPPPSGPTVRAKGDSILELSFRRGSRTTRFTGQPLRAGDVLLVRHTTERRHLILLGVEAAGRVSVFVPAEGLRSATLEAGERVRLGTGVELDDSPGPERVFAVLSDAPLSLDAVRRAFEAAFASLPPAGRDTLDLGAHLALDAEVVSWLIRKERTP